jgi:redox-sensitive bicupin YhaK (pirin superfamily)
MSSGRGILHEEMPRRGPSGFVTGFQLWVNLPSHLKMSEPRYQEVTAATIPTYEKDGVKIRVVAGTVDGVTVPFRTSPPRLFTWTWSWRPASNGSSPSQVDTRSSPMYSKGEESSRVFSGSGRPSTP